MKNDQSTLTIREAQEKQAAIDPPACFISEEYFWVGDKWESGESQPANGAWIFKRRQIKTPNGVWETRLVKVK